MAQNARIADPEMQLKKGRYVVLTAVLSYQETFATPNLHTKTPQHDATIALKRPIPDL
jgi:hypothetical protein